MYVYSYGTQWVQWYNIIYKKSTCIRHNPSSMSPNTTTQSCGGTSPTVSPCRPARVRTRSMRCVDSTRTSRTVTLRPQDTRRTVNGRLYADHTPRQLGQQLCLDKNIAPHSTGRTRVTQCSCKCPA